MRKAIISQSIGNISINYVDEAAEYRVSAKTARLRIWRKISAVAACIALVAALGISIFQSRDIEDGDHIVTLDNGSILRFVRSDADETNKPAFGSDVESRRLSEDEINVLFNQMPVTANAHFSRADHSMIGLDGSIGNVKLMVAVPEATNSDLVNVGDGQASEVNGISVYAGYCITDSVSEGAQSVIYYATFALGDNTVYVEHEGSTDDGEAARTELTAIILMLIDNGSVDMGQITFDREAFTPPITLPIIPEWTEPLPPADAPDTTEPPTTLPIA